MEDATEAELPKPKLGSPPITKIPIDPKDEKILSDEFKTLYEKFKEIPISSDLPQYCRVVRDLRDIINKPIRFLSTSNEWKSGRIVDQDGKAGTPEGQELIKQTSIKLGGDLSSLLNQPPVGTSEHRRRIVRDIRQAATWLFAEAPPEVVGYLKTKLDEDREQSERDVIEAAGRSFTATDDIKVLYRAILQRIDHPLGRTAFPIHSARAICRILELREFGPDALTRADAETFVKQALITMENCVAAGNFKQSFFVVIPPPSFVPCRCPGGIIGHITEKKESSREYQHTRHHRRSL